MRIDTEQVSIPAGSTIGYGFGTTDDGTVEVIFTGDHRAMRALGEMIAELEAPIPAEVPDWAVIAMREKRLR